MSTLWSGRFDSEPNAAVFDFGASFRFDRRLFEDDVIGSLAWADALADAGALSAEDAASIRTALTDILAKGQAEPAWVSGAGAAFRYVTDAGSGSLTTIPYAVAGPSLVTRIVYVSRPPE